MSKIKTRYLVLESIEAYRQEHGGLSPTYQWIADDLGIGRTTVHHHVHSLIADGELNRDGHVRGLVPVEDTNNETD